MERPDRPDRPDRPSGVEFLTGGGDSSVYGEDLVEFGRGRTPRWLLAVFVAVTIGLALTAVATKSRHTRAATPPAPPVTATPSRTAPAVLPPYINSALSIGPTAAIDVAVMGARVYVLQIGRLAVMDLHTSRILAHTPVGNFFDGPSLRLVSDPAGEHIWVIAVDIAPALILDFDARTLARLRVTTWPQPVHSAAMLDGDLYLQTNGVAVLARGAATPRLVPSLARETGAIAADSLRHRLLVLHIGSPSRIVTYSRGGVAHTVPTSLDVVKGSIAVVDGHVWLAGSGPYVAELEELDPITFVPGSNNPIFDFLGAGALLLARGQHVLWIGAASGQMQPSVSCVDATDGREQRSWFGVGGRVASGDGAGFIADGAAVLPLQLGACRG